MQVRILLSAQQNSAEDDTGRVAGLSHQFRKVSGFDSHQHYLLQPVRIVVEFASFSHWRARVQIPYRLQEWSIRVVVILRDCLSRDLGSIPRQTAKLLPQLIELERVATNDEVGGLNPSGSTNWGISSVGQSTCFARRGSTVRTRYPPRIIW